MRSTIPLFLLILLPAAGAAQVNVEPSVLGGVFVTDRETQLPASLAFNAGLDVRVGVPSEGYRVAIAPFFGVDGTLMMIENRNELLTTIRAGFRLDSPGYPRLFGFLGPAWPENTVDDDEADPAYASQTVYGGGLSLRYRRATLEGRYAYDRRWVEGRRTMFAILVGSTF
ncbi:MAG: hypothetical protein OXN92_01285 [Gammaproteobacteria bacterium]|nr:hypothetical protein [Gammaproteobacteria bacterium]MDE0260091.1 hypothetical protein [Gammaproteobacteria bacterium]MDE0356363.1 hypothetical protein [Gammaproteobacteria bacterium]